VDELQGKVAVVTGAASGIGLALAQRSAAEGMKVVLADVEAGPLEAAAAELRASGADVVAQVTDVSKGEQVDALGQAALEAFGAVHLVCNNAGVGGGGLMQGLTTADWEWVLGVNLWGVIHGMRVFLPRLLEQGEGHIVNTASLAGLVAAPFMGPYNASKFAVVAISETTYRELQMQGSEVGVSVLCPAWVRTRIHESSRNRPEALQNEPVGEVDPEAVGGVESVIGGLIANGLAPEDVAGQVFDAVHAKRLYILTHPESVDGIRARMESIVTGQVAPVVIPQ
jgi:NAD(P)-dependent dehydrogenase (short-subunit alcohol dehydrogenase family)